MAEETRAGYAPGRDPGAGDPRRRVDIRRHELAAFLRTAASTSPPSRSACPAAAAAARRACAARRSPSSPRSASPGTRGSNRPGTSRSPSRSSTPSPARCCSTRASAPTSSSWPGPSTRRRPPRCPSITPALRADAGAARADPGLRAEQPVRHPRLQPHVRALLCDLDAVPPEDRNCMVLVLHARRVALVDRAPGGDPAADGRQLPRLDGRASRRARLEDAAQAAARGVRRSSARSGSGTRWSRTGSKTQGVPQPVRGAV